MEVVCQCYFTVLSLIPSDFEPSPFHVSYLWPSCSSLLIFLSSLSYYANSQDLFACYSNCLPVISQTVSSNPGFFYLDVIPFSIQSRNSFIQTFLFIALESFFWLKTFFSHLGCTCGFEDLVLKYSLYLYLRLVILDFILVCKNNTT